MLAAIAILFAKAKLVPWRVWAVAGGIVFLVGLDFYRVHEARVDQRDTDKAEFTASAKADIDAAQAKAVKVQQVADAAALKSSQEALQRQQDAAVYFNALQGAFHDYVAKNPLAVGCVFDPERVRYANQKRTDR